MSVRRQTPSALTRATEQARPDARAQTQEARNPLRYMWLGVLAIGGVVLLVGHFKTAAAEGRLGDDTVATIQAVAYAASDEYYETGGDDGGGWGDKTCRTFKAKKGAKIESNGDVERVWDDRLSDAFESNPAHESRTSLGEHPKWADLAAEC